MPTTFVGDFFCLFFSRAFLCGFFICHKSYGGIFRNESKTDKKSRRNEKVIISNCACCLCGNIRIITDRGRGTGIYDKQCITCQRQKFRTNNIWYRYVWIVKWNIRSSRNVIGPPTFTRISNVLAGCWSNADGWVAGYVSWCNTLSSRWCKSRLGTFTWVYIRYWWITVLFISGNKKWTSFTRADS